MMTKLLVSMHIVLGIMFQHHADILHIEHPPKNFH